MCRFALLQCQRRDLELESSLFASDESLPISLHFADTQLGPYHHRRALSAPKSPRHAFEEWNVITNLFSACNDPTMSAVRTAALCRFRASAEERKGTYILQTIYCSIKIKKPDKMLMKRPYRDEEADTAFSFLLSTLSSPDPHLITSTAFYPS